MFEVVLTLCALANPSQCEQRGYGTYDQVLTCYASSQEVIAEQMEAGLKYDWSVKKWGCRRVNK